MGCVGEVLSQRLNSRVPPIILIEDKQDGFCLADVVDGPLWYCGRYGQGDRSVRSSREP